MLYFWISTAYSIVNAAIAFLILVRSRKNLLSRFYGFCVFSLLGLGLSAHLFIHAGSPGVRELLRLTTGFLYSVFPFFFLHFMLVFIRRYEILRSNKIILANYFAGIFSYAMVLLGWIPVPFSAQGITLAGYIYYLTWMSILFSVGVALLYSVIGGFSERGMQSNLLFGALVVLMLLLPTPFTLSVFSVVGDTFVWYFLSSTAALTVVVYIVFRHRITMNTPYQAMKAALGAMNDLLVKTDRRLRIDLAQGGIVGVLGYSEHEMKGMMLDDLAKRKEPLEELRARLQEGKPNGTSFETDLLCRDGSTVPMEFSFTPVFANEEIVGAVGVGRNIQERRRAERLKESAYRIAQAADSAATLDVLFHEVHRIISDVMPADNFYIALLHEKENFVSFPYFVDHRNRVIPARRPARGLTEYVLRTGKPLLCDHELLERLTTEGTVECPGTPSVLWLGVPLTVRGKTIGVMAVQEYNSATAYGVEELQLLEYVSTQVAQSIERKRAEEALRVSEENYRRIFEEDLTGNACLAPDGRIIDCNPAFLRIFGFALVEEARATRMEGLYPDPRMFTGMVDELKRVGTIRHDEAQLRKVDGQTVYVVQNVVGRFDRQHHLTEILMYVFDDTDRIVLEDQLRQSQKMENLGSMAGGIAHDFNNILTIMAVHLSMVRSKRGGPARAEEALEAISKAVRRGTGLVSQLLTFARKTEVLFESVNVNHLLTELVQMLAATFPKTVTIAFTPEEHLPTISADQNQLHQAVLNLCVNARDAMPDGGRITITARVEDGTGLRRRFPEAHDDRYVAVSVTDTGTGMDAATRERIFEPFFTTKEKGKGTGLGLAVVYGVVRGHQGFIDVTSEPGTGTTFTLYLHAPNRGLSSGTEEGGEQEEEIRPGTATILLVEDEDLVRESLKGLFEERGYTILAARDGNEAVEIYTRSHAEIDVVLTDIGLPKRDGWSAFKAMREINPAVRAIFATGYVEPSVRNEMTRQGAQHFVQKPYVPKQLFKQVESILQENVAQSP
jgi:two-component system, cell cycle sensor histidine kinase and response regulator CckA